MGNSLRCCLACILPCGALDVIRIVHLNGQVEEYSQVTAGEILAANPNHVISKLCSQEVRHRILIVSPDSDLKRGHIYFLIPAASFPEKENKKQQQQQHYPEKENKKKQQQQQHYSEDNKRQTTVNKKEKESFETDKIEKKAGHHRRSSSKGTTWRPHLESITESSSS